MIGPILFIFILFFEGAKDDWDFRISDLVKTPMELIFNPCGKFRWSPEGPVSQIHFPQSTLVPLGFFFRSFKVCSDAKERVGCRKQREAIAPIQSLVKLQPWFLSLRWKTCLRQNFSLGSCSCSEGLALGQNTLMVMIYFERNLYNVSKFDNVISV